MTPEPSEPSPTGLALLLPILVGLFAVCLHYARRRDEPPMGRGMCAFYAVVCAFLAALDLNKLDASFQPVLVGLLTLLGVVVKGGSESKGASGA